MANYNFNFIDFYICYPGHPMFSNVELIEDDVVKVIIQKYHMIIFTNKGEVLGEPNFGADLTLLLHETKLSAESVEGDIRAQIADYIPEIDQIGYELSVEFFDDPERHQEYMVVNFTIADYQVYATVN
jgi:hypothetical protein